MSILKINTTPESFIETDNIPDDIYREALAIGCLELIKQGKMKASGTEEGKAAEARIASYSAS